jgi:hypothetical protein
VGKKLSGHVTCQSQLPAVSFFYGVSSFYANVALFPIYSLPLPPSISVDERDVFDRRIIVLLNQVEFWSTSVVVEKGWKLVLEVSSGDTKDSGIFQHNHPSDRPFERFHGVNSIRFGLVWENYVTLPVIPPKEE